MQPQYFPPQAPQYGQVRAPGPGYNGPPGNYPPDSRPSPVGTPGNYQANGASELTNQMSGMNIASAGQPQGFPSKVPGSFPAPPVNGAVNGTNSRPPSTQQATTRPVMQGGQFPPNPAHNMSPQVQPGQFPPHPSQLPPQQPGQFSQQSGQFPPLQPGQLPSQQPGQFPPQQPGQLPPQTGQFPSHPSQLPPQQPGQLPPHQPGQVGQPPGKVAPHPAHMPPQLQPGQPASHLQGQRPPSSGPPGQIGPQAVGARPPPSSGFPPPQQQRGFPPPGQPGPASQAAQPGPGFTPNSGLQPAKQPGFPPQQGMFGAQQTPTGTPNYQQPTGGQYSPPNQPMGSQFPPTQPMGGQHPPNQPIGGQYSPPNQPMGGQYPPTQPMGGQYPPTQPMGGQYPPTQPMGGQYPPTQPMGGQYPPTQPMGGQYPPTQPMGGQYPPAQPMGGQYPSTQPQQARRLDPDQMPSPIQVMQDDQRNRAGVFVTNQKGLVPPIATTDFTTHDQGHCSPRYMRSTMYNVPATQDMMKQAGVPFSLVISPLASPYEGEYEPPVVDMGAVGPVRCVRCKAYMCPYMQFVDGGRRFHCLFCKATSDVPAEYFQHLDHTGQRVDRHERPELLLGCYEFVATKDYCRNNVSPKPPAYIFLLDVSYNNVKSGLVALLCGRMKEVLRSLPRDHQQEQSCMRVGFITYNSSVHFYNVKGCLAQAQMMVVGDIADMFMPLLDGFLVEPEQAEQTIDSLLAEIPTMFRETRDTETLLAPAIQAGLEALKAAECVGKLLVFHSSLPIAEAPGKLKNRDDRKLLGTDKEKTVLVPQSKAYNELAQDCVASGCSVDLFLFNNSYIDIATIGQVARLTGGEIYKYTYFQADLDGERLIADLKHNVSRAVGFDAIMRVRTSTGVRPTDFYGHFFMQNTTDMEMATVDCDKAVALEIKHDDALTEEDGVYIQVALLYTSCGGQRRLRILNLGLKTCTQMADLYRSCDLDTLVNFFSKQAVSRLLVDSPKPVKDALVARCAQILASYRKNCASPSSAGQLILPECMKLLPLYVNCLMKSDAIAGGSEMTLDDRSFVMQAVTTMDVPSSVAFFYPRLLPLIELDDEGSDIPHQVRCSSDKLRDDGAYILENGIHMFLWVGLSVDTNWVTAVFGVQSSAQIDIDRTQLPELDNATSARVRALVEDVRLQRHRSMRLTLVRQRDKMELVFKHFLVEDRGLDSSPSYVDFLCHMHKEIRSLLS